MTGFITLREQTRVIGPFGKLEFRSAEAHALHFEHLGENRRIVTFTQEEFRTLLRDPHIKLDSSPHSSSRLKNSHAHAFASVQDAERERALYRLRFVHAYETHVSKRGLIRTDSAIEEMMPSIADMAEHMKSAKQGSRKPRAGNVRTTRVPPSARSLRKWHATFDRSGRDPMSLVFLRSRPTRKKAYDPEVEAVIAKMFTDYLITRGPSKAIVKAAALTEFGLLSDHRKNLGQLHFDAPCASTLDNRIKDLEPFEVHSRRHGLDAARRKYSVYEAGLPDHRIGHRVEIDEWKIDVYSLFAQAGLISGLSLAERKRIPKGRRQVLVAIDCASRIVLGIKFATVPNSATSIALLEQICTDKTEISEAYGCVNSWNHYSGVEDICSDQGAAYACDEFRQAGVNLGWNVGTPPAAMPQLRATIERLFRTFGLELMPYLVGRVFSNPREKGDYPAEDLAVLTDDDLERIFVKFIVDIYHVKPHAGLMTSPMQAWEEMAQGGILSVPDALTRCVALGQEVTRSNDRGGIVFTGQRYVSPYLQKQAVEGRSGEVRVRHHHSEMGWVAVFNGNDWEPAYCTDKRMEGMSLKQWQQALSAMRLRYKSTQELTRIQVSEAYGAIAGIVRNATERVGLIENQVTIDQVGKAIDSQFWALAPAPSINLEPPELTEGSAFLMGAEPPPARPEADKTIKPVTKKWPIRK